jgi:16S rRNA C967 or C1407 C5-methylase (RsmB/RsmF family)
LAGDSAAAADWTPRKCKRLASEQKAILHSAIESCLPDGVLVYSTCTLGMEENEMVLARAVQLYEGRIALEPLPVEIPGALPAFTQWETHEFPAALAHARRIVPLPAAAHPDGPWLEGFFIARLRKLA